MVVPSPRCVRNDVVPYLRRESGSEMFIDGQSTRL
jgi:hypothetical protein